MRSYDSVPRPTHRLHAAIGLVPLRDDESLLPLVESRLPAGWVELDEDAQMDRQLQLVGDYLRGQSELVAEVDVANREELAALTACPGARSGDRPYQVLIPLTEQNLLVLLSLNPSSTWVTRSDGSPVLLQEDNWDGVFVYA